MNDLRFAFRQLRKAPGVHVHGAGHGRDLSRGEPRDFRGDQFRSCCSRCRFPHSDRLVTIYNTYPKAGVENDGSSLTNYYERRGNIPAFSSLSIYTRGSRSGGRIRVRRSRKKSCASRRIFSRRWASVWRSVALSPKRKRPSAEERGVVILSDAFWRERLNSDPNVLGRDLRVNGMPRKIVGVLPPGFRFLSSEARLFLPLKSGVEQRAPSQRHSGGGGTHMIARLKPGATIAEAQAQIDAHNAAVEKDNPQAKMMAEAGFPFAGAFAPCRSRALDPPDALADAGRACFSSSLIGAVNLVNLLLIRASGRAKEMAIRQSMGASRWHVVRQVMIETVLLTATGGLLGLLVGAWGTQLLEVLGANRLPLGAHIVFDGWLAAIGLVGAVILGVVIAMPIAWFNLGSHLANALQSESRSGTINRATQRLRHGFIVAQIALAFVLLAGAALLGLSLKKVMAVSPGFRADHVLTGECTHLVAKLDEDAESRIVDRLLEAIRPATRNRRGRNDHEHPAERRQRQNRGHTEGLCAAARAITAWSLFLWRDAAITFRRSAFRCAKDASSPRKILTARNASAWWTKILRGATGPRRGRALGQRVFQGTDSETTQNLFTIVGVVGAVKQAELTEAQGQGAVYLPFAYREHVNSIFVVTRTSQRPEAFAATLRKLVRATDPELAIDDIQLDGNAHRGEPRSRGVRRRCWREFSRGSRCCSRRSERMAF